MIRSNICTATELWLIKITSDSECQKFHRGAISSVVQVQQKPKALLNLLVDLARPGHSRLGAVSPQGWVVIFFIEALHLSVKVIHNNKK